MEDKNKKPVRKPFYETALEDLNEHIKNTIKDVPEIVSVSLVIDWAVGNDDLPAGKMVLNNSDETKVIVTHEAILSQIKQMSKMQASLLRSLSIIVSKYEEQIKKLVTAQSTPAIESETKPTETGDPK